MAFRVSTVLVMSLLPSRVLVMVTLLSCVATLVPPPADTGRTAAGPSFRCVPVDDQEIGEQRTEVVEDDREEEEEDDGTSHGWAGDRPCFGLVQDRGRRCSLESAVRAPRLIRACETIRGPPADA